MTKNRNMSANWIENVLIDDILNASGEEVLAEVVEEFGDLATFEAKMEDIFTLALQRTAIRNRY